jgi:FtsH-binding integral membrane protein
MIQPDQTARTGHAPTGKSPPADCGRAGESLAAAIDLLIGLLATEVLFDEPRTATLLLAAALLLFAGGARVRTRAAPGTAPPDLRRVRRRRRNGWLLVVAGLAVCYVASRDARPFDSLSGSGPEFMLPLAVGFLIATLIVLARLVDRWALPAAALAGALRGANVLLGFGLASQFAWLAQAPLREVAFPAAVIVGVGASAAALRLRSAAESGRVGRIAALALLNAALAGSIWFALHSEREATWGLTLTALAALSLNPLFLSSRAANDAATRLRCGLRTYGFGIFLSAALAAALVGRAAAGVYVAAGAFYALAAWLILGGGRRPGAALSAPAAE